MNAYRILFADGNEIITDMNATLPEAQAYYLGQAFNFGDTDECPKDRMVKAIFVEQLS